MNSSGKLDIPKVTNSGSLKLGSGRVFGRTMTSQRSNSLCKQVPLMSWCSSVDSKVSIAVLYRTCLFQCSKLFVMALCAFLFCCALRTGSLVTSLNSFVRLVMITFGNNVAHIRFICFLQLLSMFRLRSRSPWNIFFQLATMLGAYVKHVSRSMQGVSRASKLFEGFKIIARATSFYEFGKRSVLKGKHFGVAKWVTWSQLIE